LELRRLLSLGALVEESLSTRRDSVRAPERLCEPDREDERLLRGPELDRLRELVLERFFEELWELPERLLRDRELDPERRFLPLDAERELFDAILLLLARSVRVSTCPNPAPPRLGAPSVPRR